jgi:hypothetical protein
MDESMVFRVMLMDIWIVCVSSAMIQEVKRIIKNSEILKYANTHHEWAECCLTCE